MVQHRDLSENHRKRDFRKSREPASQADRSKRDERTLPRFVIQEHRPTSLHYDLRLEVDGTLAGRTHDAGRRSPSPESVLSGRTIEEVAAQQ